MDAKEYEELAARLDATEPRQTKQQIVDSLLDRIEIRMQEGCTVDQIAEAIFPGMKYKTFHTMLSRARKKRG